MLKEFGIEGIYIVHAKKGYEYHQQRMRKFSVNYTFIMSS
jgi:hypothetical protein